MEVKLKHKKTIITFLIDDEDLGVFKSNLFQVAPRASSFYLFSRKSNRYFHRVIMKAPKHLWVDHINNDPTDNRKCNLRLIEPRKNMWNRKKCSKRTSSKYIGVSFEKQTQMWRATAMFKDKYKNLGRYRTENEAALAYNEFIQKNRDEHAKLNIIT